ncbi:hypothetical protein E2C01_008279 [Portunus trituberculatus]|uniref:Uncharacterized protein n=1 Tax=Portunus trituberculatus TaxID=210409 RepID=A0A5B7D1X8_PORTR|nr:hypothetical protein [Portunus trituberculatus]
MTLRGEVRRGRCREARQEVRGELTAATLYRTRPSRTAPSPWPVLCSPNQSSDDDCDLGVPRSRLKGRRVIMRLTRMREGPLVTPLRTKGHTP